MLVSMPSSCISTPTGYPTLYLVCKNLDLNERCRQIHGPWLKEMYVPSGNEMLYMNMGAMAGGYPGFGLFILTL